MSTWKATYIRKISVKMIFLRDYALRFRERVARVEMKYTKCFVMQARFWVICHCVLGVNILIKVQSKIRNVSVYGELMASRKAAWK